jgi:hypothetical protein
MQYRRSVQGRMLLIELETSSRTESKRMINHNTPQLSGMGLPVHCATFPWTVATKYSSCTSDSGASHYRATADCSSDAAAIIVEKSVIYLSICLSTYLCLSVCLSVSLSMALQPFVGP